jgi:hypothetical protein
MTTTLNASTSSGLVVTPDNSGNILLQYNGVAAPAFCANAATTQSLPNTTYTKVTLGTEVFDTNNNFASSTFTPTVAGYYIITGSVTIQSAAAAVYTLIYKNGSSVAAGTALPATGIFSGIATVSAVIYCNGSTDYIDLYVYQGSGGSVTIGSGIATQMTGCLLRGA